MASRNRNIKTEYIKYADDELLIVEGGSLIVHFEGTNERNKMVIGTHKSGEQERAIVFWGPTNSMPDQRENLIANNNIVPQLLATKRNIILGGGLMAYRETFDNGKRIINEQSMPPEFMDFLDANEVEDEFLPTQCNNLLIQGNFYTEFTRDGKDSLAGMKPQICRHVRAEKQDQNGRIPSFFLYGHWGKITNEQKLLEIKELERIPNYDKEGMQPKFMLHCADKMLGGPYYYTPHWDGSQTWIKVANCIPEFHLGNLENGFNIRYLIKVPEDYFLRSLSQDKRKDDTKLKQHITEAKQTFKNKLNDFLAGAKNAGRGLIITKHIYKHIQKEWPELEIVPLEVDLKDEAMLKLYESSNTANTSAHGTPPALAGIATGAKLTSGSEIRNLYNFFQLSATTMPRRILLKPLRMSWKSMGLPMDIKLGFRNIMMETTDKNPNGITQPIPAE